MARRFLARTVHSACTEDDLQWIDRFTRNTNPQIPADAEMIWDEGTRTMRWVWDDGTPAEDQR
jgi:hypothetical protein